VNARPPPAATPPLRDLGTVSVCLGAIEAAWESINLFRLSLQHAFATSDLVGSASVELQAVVPILLARSLSMLLMSLALVAIGVRLRGPNPSRTAVVLWCELAFAVLFARALLWEVVLWPRYELASRVAASRFSLGDSLTGLFSEVLVSFLGLARGVEYVVIGLLLPLPIVLAWVASRAGRAPRPGRLGPT
jgi:hypothetical protein